MSYQAGGITEKCGNQYEDNVLVLYFGKLMAGKYISITSESYNPNDEQGMDFIAESESGLTYIQVKSRSGNNNSWTISVFSKAAIIDNAWHHIKQGRDFKLISPLPFIFLSDLHDKSFVKNYSDLREQFNADKEFTRLDTYLSNLQLNDEEKCMFLQHFFIEVLSDNRQQFIALFNSEVKAQDPEGAFQSLSHYAINKQKLGQPITAQELWQYFESQRIGTYNIDKPAAAMQIEYICNDFKQYIGKKLINNTAIKRKEIDEIIVKIGQAPLVVISGKAGVGKSGVLFQLCEYFTEKKTLYLPISLDQYDITGDTYKLGMDLKLNASPVHALSTLAGERTSFLIIDQLDAIRWNDPSAHSAFAVCKQLVKETLCLLKKNVKLIFACRTIDAEKILQFWDTNPPDLSQCTIKIGELSAEEVNAISKGLYMRESAKTQGMLLNFNTLSMYLRLSHRNNYSNSIEIINEYLQYETQEVAKKVGCAVRDIAGLVEYLATWLNEQKTKALPLALIDDKYDKEWLRELQHAGLIEITHGMVLFAHQSILDYYCTKGLLSQVKTADEIGILQSYNDSAIDQYEVLKQFFELLQLQLDLYFSCMEKLLFDRKICVFIKSIALESLRYAPNCKEDTSLTLRILRYKGFGLRYLFYLTNHNTLRAHAFLKSRLYESVLKSNDKNLLGQLIEVLVSMDAEHKDVAKWIRECYAILKEDSQLVSFLIRLIDEVRCSDWLFDYKLSILGNNALLDYVNWGQLIHASPSRAIRYLLHLFHTASKAEDVFPWDEYGKFFNDLIQQDHLLFLNESKAYLERVCERYEMAGMFQAERSDLKAIAFRIMQTALQFADGAELLIILQDDRELFKHIALSAILESNRNELFEMMILSGFISRHDFLPHKHSLSLVADNIKKYSINLSANLFCQLEDQIMHYQAPDLLMIAKRRFEQRKNGIYYPYFGEEQMIMLEAMPLDRLHQQTKEYLVILRRKYPNRNHYGREDYIIQVGNVVCVIENKWQHFSKNTWVKLLTNPKTGHGKSSALWETQDGHYIESNRRSYYSILRKAANIKQTMFVEILLEHNNIPFDFVESILEGLEEDAKTTTNKYLQDKGISVELCDLSRRLAVFKKYYDLSNNGYLRTFLRFVHANHLFMDSWVYVKLLEIASTPSLYEDMEELATTDHPLTYENEEKIIAVKINRIRTQTIFEISRHIGESKRITQDELAILDECSSSENNALLFSAIDLLSAMSGIDMEETRVRFNRLLDTHPGLLCYLQSLYIVFAVIKRDKSQAKAYKRCIRKQLLSFKDDENTAALVLNTFIQFGVYRDIMNSICMQNAGFIMEYCGEICTDVEVDQREKDRARKLLAKVKNKQKGLRFIAHKKKTLIGLVNDAGNYKALVSYIRHIKKPISELDLHSVSADILKAYDLLNNRKELVFCLCDKAIARKDEYSTYIVKPLLMILLRLYSSFQIEKDDKQRRQVLHYINLFYKSFLLDSKTLSEDI